MKKTVNGFTIVELLIVIVVIAILAAISIVAYSGIQERARTSAHAHAAAQTERKIMTYALQENSESVSLGNTLIAYKEGAGDIDLLRPLTGTPDITMYAVFETIGASSAYNTFMRLGPNVWNSQVLLMMTIPGSPLGYRIDTSAAINQTGVTPSGFWVPGKTSVCWLQLSNSATTRAFGCDQSAPHTTGSLAAHAGWNFTSMTLSDINSDKIHVGLVFNDDHDEATRAQIIDWLADVYGVSL